ncbi:MAG: right-handed parallel beta-helix repeat-containing protein [Haloarculaceae archaeon]
MTLNSTENAVIRDAEVRDSSRGVTANGSEGVTVADATFDDLSGLAVEVTNTSDATVRNTTVSNGSEGVFARSSSNLTVRDSTFDGASGPAVEVTASSEAAVSGVEVRNGTAGVVANSTPGVRIVDLRADGVGGSAVEVANATDATVEGVEASNGSAGVSVRGSPNATVTGGNFTDLGGVAVDVTNADGALVRDVDVRNATTGVAVDASGNREISDVTVRNATVANASEGVRVDVSDSATLSGVTLSDLDLSGTDRGIGAFASGNDPTNLEDVLVEDSTIEDSEERGVEVSTVNSNPRIQRVTLRNLSVDGPGTGEGVRLSAEAGLLRNVTLRNSSISSHDVGVTVRDRAVIEDVVVLRNRVVETNRGVVLSGEGSRPLEAVGVRQNLVANASEAGVLVTDDTDARELRVTQNVIRDNARGVVNEGDEELAAWLNYWGTDSGPSDDDVSENVRFDPWLGAGACSQAGLGNVTEGPFELHGEEIGLAELRSFCAWDRAPVSLRADPADAAMDVSNLDLSYDLPGTDGPVPADRPNVTVYEAGERFDLQFGAGETDTSRFAGNDTQLIVLRDRFRTNASFDVRFDDRAGETVLQSDADSATVRDLPSPDGDGELDYSFEPSAPGSYTFVLVTRDFGPGVGDDGTPRGELRLDGGATVVGFETVVVRNTSASADATNETTGNASYPAGSAIPFELASGLSDERTDHAVLLYNESRFRNATATVEVDATAADVIAGRITPSDVTVESSVSDLNGFYRGDGGFAGLGVDVAARSASGLVDPSPFLGLGTRLYDTTATDPADAPGATPLDGSVVVRESDGPSATADVETFANFSTGTYRYVYLAGVERGRETSSDSGTIRITTPVATPTPTPGDDDDGGDGGGGGGGGGGQPGAGPSGEVELQNATLLNGTVTTDEAVVVRVNLANFDPARGRITLNFTADGATHTERTVAVGASAERTVFLRTTFLTPGTYALAVNGDPLGSVVVTAAGTEPPAGTTPPSTPTRSPTDGTGPTVTATPTDGTGPSTATGSPAPGADGTATPASDGTPAIGPPPATGTDAVIALGMTLLLLYGVGVAVYVLREHPPSRLG